jgi:hypothetical protein
MIDDGKTALLFGPYHAPALQVGDRTHCLYRDADVIITSWTDAPIPWPRCRGLGVRGGSGLLVNEELARAVRCESSLAIQRWWLASPNAVHNWRKALEVGRYEPEGTRRLNQANAEAGAAAMRKRGLTDEECDQRSARAKAGNYWRNLKPGFQGQWWTPAELQLLGTDTDAVIAAKIGRTANAVRVMRTRLGIPSLCDRRLRENRPATDQAQESWLDRLRKRHRLYRRL